MGHGVQRRKCRRRARQDVTNGKRVPAGAARGPRGRPRQEVGVGEKRKQRGRQFSVSSREERGSNRSKSRVAATRERTERVRETMKLKTKDLRRREILEWKGEHNTVLYI